MFKLKHCESSPGSCDECSTAPGGSVATDLWTKPIGLNHKPACRLPLNYTHRCHLLLLCSKADTHFTVPRRVEGWADLGYSAGYIPRWFTRPRAPQTVTHPSTNRARCRVTTLIETSTLPLGYYPNHGKRLVVCHRWLGLTRYYVTCIRPEARPVAHREIQESPAFADKPSRRESMPKIAPIRRAYNVVADNTGLFSFV